MENIRGDLGISLNEAWLGSGSHWTNELEGTFRSVNEIMSEAESSVRLLGIDKVGSEFLMFPEDGWWFETPCRSVRFGICGSENSAHVQPYVLRDCCHKS